MNKSIVHIILSLIVFFLLSCKKENMGDCFKPTGKISTSGRAIENIQHIILEDRINLFLKQAPYYKLDIEAGKNLHKLIETSTDGNTLHIKNNNKCNWVRDLKKDINVYVSLPQISSITHRGGGCINFENQFNQDIFTLTLYEASGTVNLKLNSRIVIVNDHEGTADVNCSGSTEIVEFYSNATGKIDSRSLASNTAKVLNNNSSQILLSVSDQLIAEIGGRGNIHYFGNPTVSLKKTGSGQLFAN